MRIVSSAVQMQSQHEWIQAHSREVRLRITRGTPGNDGEAAMGPAAPLLQVDRSPLSRQARQPGGHTPHGAGRTRQPEARSQTPAPEAEALSAEKVWQQLSPQDRTRILLLEKLLGFRIVIPVAPARSPDAQEEVTQPEPSSQQPVAGQPATRSFGWGLDFEYRESYRESERLSVRFSGSIRTGDGQELAFAVELHMSREFAREQYLRILAGDARPVDPLVINYAGPAADLAGGRFEFDLTADGETEELYLLREGSGYLALDRDGNGAIDSGWELFGPATGDGFTELAGYDEDGNRWIDANDPVYDRLRIWVPDADGSDRLLALGEVGVGAIYLGSVAAPFAYKDDQNRSLAANVSAGIFLRADGAAGTVQQLDVYI